MTFPAMRFSKCSSTQSSLVYQSYPPIKMNLSPSQEQASLTNVSILAQHVHESHRDSHHHRYPHCRGRIVTFFL